MSRRSSMVEQLFCTQLTWVRFLPLAPLLFMLGCGTPIPAPSPTPPPIEEPAPIPDSAPDPVPIPPEPPEVVEQPLLTTEYVGWFFWDKRLNKGWLHWPGLPPITCSNNPPYPEWLEIECKHNP